MAGCDDIKEFRPITLAGSMYKILAKVLALRLRKFIGEVISQRAFVLVVKFWMLA